MRSGKFDQLQTILCHWSWKQLLEVRAALRQVIQIILFRGLVCWGPWTPTPYSLRKKPYGSKDLPESELTTSSEDPSRRVLMESGCLGTPRHCPFAFLFNYSVLSRVCAYVVRHLKPERGQIEWEWSRSVVLHAALRRKT